MLSIKFGYGRPAFWAARIADRFCEELKDFGFPKPFGRFLSQTSFFISLTYLHSLTLQSDCDVNYS